MAPRRCFYGCEGKQTLFSFPTDLPTRLQWTEVIFPGQQKINTSVYICSRHFLPDCFLNKVKYEAGFAARLQLKPGAVPTIKGHVAESDVQASTSQDLNIITQYVHMGCEMDQKPKVSFGTQIRPQMSSAATQVLIPPSTRSAATQLSYSTPKEHVRSKGSQAAVPQRCVGTKTVEQDSPLDICSPLVEGSHLTLARPAKRPRIKLEDEEEERCLISTPQTHHSASEAGTSLTAASELGFSKVTLMPVKAERVDWTSKDEASESALDDRPLPEDDETSAPVEIELVLTKSMTDKPLAVSDEEETDVNDFFCNTDSIINLSRNRYMTLSKDQFVHLMFRCLECSNECLIRGRGRGGELTFRQECLICSFNRVWTSHAAYISDIREMACSPCGDACKLSSDGMSVPLGQEHVFGSSKPIYEDSSKVESMRDEHENNVRGDKPGFLKETHEDDLSLALIRGQTTSPNHPDSSDVEGATMDLFIDEYSGDEIDEKERSKSSEIQQGANFDMYHLISSDKENVSAGEEILTDEDRCDEFVEETSDESFRNTQKTDSDEYLPSSSDMESSACSGDETSDNVMTKKPYQNTIKLVIWCIDCESVAKLFCKVKRHKRNYCCAACVSVDNVENLSFKDFSVYFSDFRSFHLHAIAEHCGSEKLSEHKMCQDCNKPIRVQTDPNKKGHVCEHKIKPFSCDLCPKRFINENGRKVHYRRLHGEYQHTCKYCMREFNTKQSKLEHEESHKEDTLYYTCPNCQEKFTDFHARNKHLKTHPEKKHICSICNRKFTDIYRYERHLLIHSGEKPYKCDICERSFNQNGHLKSHMRVHTGEKPFLCEHCGQSFNHNISLRNHRQRQHGITDSSSVAGEENKQIGRPIRNKNQPRRQRKVRCVADAEAGNCVSDSDEETKERVQKRKSRRGKYN